jgi:hypothetical protein
MDKDLFNALTDALMAEISSSGASQQSEPPQKWVVCISDGEGGYNKHETTSLAQAQVTVRDWNATGWSAWLQDADGNPLAIARKPSEKN